MNIPDRIAFLDYQLDRCESVMMAADPGDHAYKDALDCWLSIASEILDLGLVQDTPAPKFEKVPAPTAVSMDPSQPSRTLEPDGNESVEQEAHPFEPDSSPEPEPAPEPDADLPTKQEVRTRLATLSAKHEKLNVAKIMEGVGFTRLSDIPAERYPELLRLADEAVKELD